MFYIIKQRKWVIALHPGSSTLHDGIKVYVPEDEIDPKGTTLMKPKRGKKTVTVRWKKQAARMSTSRITGYQIQLATDSKFTKNKRTVTARGYKKTSQKVTKLKAKKKYYIRIRTYKTIKGKKYCSKWSKARIVTTMK